MFKRTHALRTHSCSVQQRGHRFAIFAAAISLIVPYMSIRIVLHHLNVRELLAKIELLKLFWFLIHNFFKNSRRFIINWSDGIIAVQAPLIIRKHSILDFKMYDHFCELMLSTHFFRPCMCKRARKRLICIHSAYRYSLYRYNIFLLFFELNSLSII